MKSWKLVLGLGAACAACCAIPVLGGVALAGSVAALWACVDELLPGAALLAVLLALGWWQRRRAARATCTCATACAAGGEHARR